MTKQSRPQRSPSNERDLTFVRSFLNNLADNVSPGGIPQKHHFWSRKDEGSMFLSPETHGKYLEVCKELLERFAQDEDLSESAIDSALRTARFRGCRYSEAP